jgi:pimeloyl-ACP methyl ester carboxylesterase
MTPTSPRPSSRAFFAPFLRRFLASLAAWGLVLALGLVHPAFAQGMPIEMSEFRVKDPATGLGIYVRNKHRLDAAEAPAERTLVFVHGATYPASTAFDLPLGGRSWMDDLAARGFDVYLLDLPGYGYSDRPPAMEAPPETNPPFETTDQAVSALGAVVEAVLARRGLSRLDVMGWSWGTAIAGGYAALHPERVARLVLYAPLWTIEGPVALRFDPEHLGAYRRVTQAEARARWLRGLTPEQAAGLIPPGWFEQWAAATFATDPESKATTPPSLRAPNGVLLDLVRYWQKGIPTWDPGRIEAPVLLIQAEWDHDTPPYMAQAIFARLTRAPWKQYVMIGAGTHTVMMEKNRDQLFAAVADFLTMPAPHP